MGGSDSPDRGLAKAAPSGPFATGFAALLVTPLMALLMALLAACGGGSPEAQAAVDPLYCVDDPIAVGDHSIRIVGIGRSSTDLYLIHNLVLRTDEDEKVIIPIFEGAKLPPGSGTVAWHGKLLTVTEQVDTPPGIKLAPCARVNVGPIPDDYVSPNEEDPSGH